MPPLPPELATYLPLLPVLAAVVLPTVAGLVAGGLAWWLGLDAVPLPGLPRLRWSAAAGGLVFLLGVCAVVGSFATGAQDVAVGAAGLLLRVGAAGACLYVGAWWAHARDVPAEGRDGRDGRDDPRAAGRDRALGLAGGALAALASLAGAGGAALLLGGLLALLAAVALYGGDLGDVLRDALRDVAAGIELRARLTPGAVLEVDGRPVTIAARAGLVGTRIVGGGEVDNRRVLAALGAGAIAAEGGG